MWGSIFSSVFQFSWPRIDVDWMSCNVHFLGEFNFKLSIVIPFLTPSEVLRVGTYRIIFSSAFQFSLSRMVVDWMSCNCAILCDFNVELCVVVSISNTFRGVENWNAEKYFFFAFQFLWPQLVVD